MKKIHFLFGVVVSVWTTMLFAQAGCNGSWELTRMQRAQLQDGIPMNQVWPPITDDKFGFKDGSACILSLDFQINGPYPNENGVVVFQGSQAWCQSVVNRQLVQQCGIM